mmetsp:Transcript_35818/g.74510  ORF Transcript_35818/g.74510 Transcript_35818/m.74510 type:complete len:83 (-) Transcript_35818:583-831(-)
MSIKALQTVDEITLLAQPNCALELPCILERSCRSNKSRFKMKEILSSSSKMWRALIGHFVVATDLLLVEFCSIPATRLVLTS